MKNKFIDIQIFFRAMALSTTLVVLSHIYPNGIGSLFPIDFFTIFPFVYFGMWLIKEISEGFINK